MLLFIQSFLLLGYDELKCRSFWVFGLKTAVFWILMDYGIPGGSKEWCREWVYDFVLGLLLCCIVNLEKPRLSLYFTS